MMMTTDNPKKTNNIETFSWENEIPIHNGLDIINLFQALHNGQYYELPFSINAHGKYFYTLLFMRSALQLKANILGTTLKPNKFITSQTMAKLAMDYLWFGNCYLEKVVSKTGKLLALNHSPAKYTRKDKDNIFKFLINENTALDDNKNIHTYAQDSIYHLLQYDVNQEIYGVPAVATQVTLCI